MFPNRWFATSFVLLTAFVLTACSRDNPLSNPAPVPIEEEEVCNELSLDIFQFVSQIGIDLGHERITLPVIDQSDLDTVNVNFLMDRMKLDVTFSSDMTFTRSDFSDEVIDNLRNNIESQEDFDAQVDDFIRDQEGLAADDPIVFPIEENVGGEIFLRDRSYFVELFVEQEIDATIAKLETAALSVSIDLNDDLSDIDDEIELSNNEQSRYLDLLADSDNEFNIRVRAQVRFPILLSLCSIDNDADEFKFLDVERVYPLSIFRNSGDSVAENQQIIQPDSLDEGDQFGASVAINGFINTDDELIKLIAASAHLEDSDEQGVYSGTSLGDQDANNFAEDTGAVFVSIEDLESERYIADAYIKASNAEQGDQFGYSVSLDGNLLAVSAPLEDSSATGVNGREDDNLAVNSGAVYIFRRDTDTSIPDSVIPEVVRWRQDAYIKPPRSNLGDIGFGESLVLKDGLLFVGAPRESSLDGLGDGFTPESGAVYIYYLSDENEWIYASVIKPSIVGEGDFFGASLSYDDGNLLIGAPREDSNYNGIINAINFGDIDSPGLNNDKADSGAVYLYSINNAGQNFFFSYIKPSESDIGDQFGISVSISDGIILVGVPYDDSNGQGLNRNKDNNELKDSGAVYGFGQLQESSGWSELVYIKPPFGQERAFFGSSLAANLNDLIVGAPRHLEMNTLGKYYIYEPDSSVEAKLNAELELVLGSTISMNHGDAESAFFGSDIDVFSGDILTGSPAYVRRVTNESVGAVFIER